MPLAAPLCTAQTLAQQGMRRACTARRRRLSAMVFMAQALAMALLGTAAAPAFWGPGVTVLSALGPSMASWGWRWARAARALEYFRVPERGETLAAHRAGFLGSSRPPTRIPRSWQPTLTAPASTRPS